MLSTLAKAPVVLIGPGKWGKALLSTLKSSHPKFICLGPKSTEREWKKAFITPSLVLIACPFSAVQSTLKRLRGYKILGVINASKGIDRESLLPFSAMAKKILKAPTASLSGPTFAQEVQAKLPTACVLAGKNRAFVTQAAKLFQTPTFRIYSNADPIGVELCASIKNVLAIACGISDGLSLGQNARAALLTRGLQEMMRVVAIFGGKRETVSGLAGVGDLWLTATGNLSRNRQLGLKLAEGNSIERALEKIAGPVEGYYTVKQIESLAKKFRIDLPICHQIYRICYESQNPKRALHELMTRDARDE